MAVIENTTPAQKKSDGFLNVDLVDASSTKHSVGGIGLNINRRAHAAIIAEHKR